MAKGSRRVLSTLLAVGLLLVSIRAAAQQGGGGRGPGRGSTPPVPYDDYTGFSKLWDGATFTNWNGETDVWRIEDGAIHADTTKTPGQHHIHYTGPGAIMRDFDLKVEVKLSATGANGGIQYRSRLLHASHGGSIQDPFGKSLPPGITTFAQAVAAGIATAPLARGGGAGNRGGGANAGGANPPAPGGPAPAAAGAAAPGGPAGPGAARGAGRGGPVGPNGPTTEPNPWQVSGYQFDLDSNNNYTGQLYEGQGRGIVTPPGTMVELLPGRIAARIGTITDNPTGLIKAHQGLVGEWNQLEIIARGNTLIHMINGKVISVSVDDNLDFRAFQGLLSLQLEGSGQIWYRNVYVKALDKPLEFPK
jgi:hypothetical protein